MESGGRSSHHLSASGSQGRVRASEETHRVSSGGCDSGVAGRVRHLRSPRGSGPRLRILAMVSWWLLRLRLAPAASLSLSLRAAVRAALTASMLTAENLSVLGGS